MTSEEHLIEAAAQVPLLPLTLALNDLGPQMCSPAAKNPQWRAFSALSREFYNRMATHYTTVSDEEAAAVLVMTMSESWVDKCTTAQIVADVVEAEIRSRFVAASNLADAFLDGTSLDDSTVGEYDHLRVLLDATGINP